MMKNMVFCVIPLLMVLMGCARSVSPTAVSAVVPAVAVAETNGGSSGMDMDAAIREAAAQMEARIPSKTMVALVSVASPSTAFSTQVLTRLESAIVSSGKLVVVDRANLDKVREEQGFQLSGEVAIESTKSIGNLLGAGAIVTGSLTDLGDVYSLTLKAINIETATVEVSYLADLAKSARIETLLASGGGGAGTGTRTAQVATTPMAPTAPTYKIGDTGPAGGLIFYDKGNNSGGWRYLEAAPAALETTAQWHQNSGPLGELGVNAIGETSKEVGMGQTNTQNIMRYFSQNGGGFGLAVQVCDELAVNGFDDWFLPSQDELSYMYGNLYRKGLGGFRNEWYSSSTIIKGNYSGGSFAPSRINFANGEPGDGESAVSRRVRAIRQF